MTQQGLQPGIVVAEKYRVVRQLGQGGMGTVYLVQHVKTDERLAMKMLNASVVDSPAARERFRREARTPARIDSDHVARVVDSDIATELGDVPYIVMEYLKGRDLQALSDEAGPLPPEEVVTYLRQMALALDKAHGLGIVHRDLKPENLFLVKRDDGTPIIKLLDFGVAKLTGAAADLARQRATATGTIFGTPLYMSPEQCKSEADKVGPRTDVWALGLITYRLLAGQDFWTAESLTHLIAQIAYEPIPAASERGFPLGHTFDLWFARCCARDVEERFASAGEAIAKLEAALGLPPLARPSGVFAAVEAAGNAFKTTDGGATSPKSAVDPLKHTTDALARDTAADAVVAGLPPRRPRWLWFAAAGAVVLLLGAVVFSGAFRDTASDRDAAASASSGALPSSEGPAIEGSAAAPISSATAAPVTTSSAGNGPNGGPTASATSTAAAVPPPVVRPAQPPVPLVQPPIPPPSRRPPPPPRDPLSGRH